MEDFTTASHSDKQDEHILSSDPLDFLGRGNSDMEGLESLDVLGHKTSTPCIDADDEKEDLIGNPYSFGSTLASTTRPLITSNEEEVPVLSKGDPFSNLLDYANEPEFSLMPDVETENSFRDSVAELQPQRSGGDSLLIGGVGLLDECETLKSSSDIDRKLSPSRDSVQEQTKEPIALVRDPKIGDKQEPKSDIHNSGFSAYESSAQAAPVKREVAMEAETVGNAAKNSDGECPFSPGVWFNPEKLHPVVADYVYWRDPKKSGIAFGASLVLLLSLKYFSFISVVAYLTLALLSVTVSFRIYKNVLQAVQKSNEGHPFKEYLEKDITLSQDKVGETVETLIHHVNCVTGKLRSLVLVEDLVDTLKLGILAWCMTYIGAWFNGMTLIILGLVSSFTLPKVYETNKANIDKYVDVARTKGKEVFDMVNAKIPMCKKKEQ